MNTLVQTPTDRVVMVQVKIRITSLEVFRVCFCMVLVASKSIVPSQFRTNHMLAGLCDMETSAFVKTTILCSRYSGFYKNVRCVLLRLFKSPESKPVFLRHEKEIRALCPDDFQTASAGETAHQSFSNPFMRSLRQNVSSICAKVMGTDESRIKIRPFIWGMCVMKNPPSIWLTINPADIQDPIAQVLCGEEFNLDDFNAADQQPSANAIAADPFAAASFFHFMVNTVLQKLFGIMPCDQNG